MNLDMHALCAKAANGRWRTGSHTALRPCSRQLDDTLLCITEMACHVCGMKMEFTSCVSHAMIPSCTTPDYKLSIYVMDNVDGTGHSGIL